MDLRQVFHRLATPIILYDQSLTITGCNDAAGKLLGPAAVDAVGEPCQTVFHCPACDPHCGLPVGLREARPSPAMVRQHQPDGPGKMVVIRTHTLPEGAMAIIDTVAQAAPRGSRDLVAASPAMQAVREFLDRAALSEASIILLEGESGVGKDVAARSLHARSPRQAGPFLAVNCASIPATLLESELFGYEAGAFTDASARKPGLFELADGGTLFLDEVGETPLTVQAKLLQVLEGQCFRHLGGVDDIQVDVRVVAATNRDLRALVEQGKFRRDLYYRLNVIQVTIPSLRDRLEDLAPLVELFLEQLNVRYKRHIPGLSPDALDLLRQYPWPGNVRELRNALERAMVVEESDWITPASLPAAIAESHPSLEEQERALIAQALEKAGGNQALAARMLGIGRDALRYRRKKAKGKRQKSKGKSD
ncbi:MAG: sigma 54-interacting transcriptional regulator [Acidobacteria bacterium]|nr:sigma 54-interacting transcriptional regulator [Acidobacteriota bacterium]